MSSKLGKKFDSDKPRMYLLPPKALLEVGKVLTFGAVKYDEDNWRHLDNVQNRYSGGALRHIFSHLDGELKDEETDLSHLAHAICCLLFKLELELELETEKTIEEPNKKPAEAQGELNTPEFRESYQTALAFAERGRYLPGT